MEAAPSGKIRSRPLTNVDIDGRTRIVALLGNPVEHTRSPAIHNTAFREQGLNYRYVALNVEPESLPEAVKGLAALNFLGANVTIPHKQAVLPLLDEVTPRAQAVGAVNTISIHGAGSEKVLHGDNTDVAGFLAPLAPHLEEVRKWPVVLFGGGGSARAVVYGVLNVLRPPALYVAVRSEESARRMVSELTEGDDITTDTHVIPINDAGPHISDSCLIVNCTPLGMHPDVETSPWENVGDFREGQVVYDLVYNPVETRFLRMAASRGATTIGGLEMLIQQASAAYRQWTGRQMPVEAVRDALTQQAESSL